MGEEIKTYLETLRKEQGLTQQQLADLANIPVGTVSRYLSSPPKDPSYITVAALVTALGGSLDALNGGKPLEKCISSGEEGIPKSEENSSDEVTYRIAMHQALSASRDAYTHAYTAIKEQHETELARVKQYLRTKDKWLIAMFAYCIVLTMIVVFKF